jgi:hypothetical protein
MKSKRPKRMRQRREMKLKVSLRRVTWVSSTLIVLLAIGFTIFFNFSSKDEAYAAANGDYRSKTSGNWSSTGTWQRYNGSSWVNASSSPNSGNNNITIQSPHTVTVTADVTADQIDVNSGATLTVNSGKKLTLNNGTGFDLSVSGTIRNAGEVKINTGATMEVNSSGKYQHAHTTAKGTLPSATWDNGSTCEITGYTTSSDGPDNLDQSFSNFIWNCPLQLTEVKLKGTLTTVNRNFEIKSTGLLGSLTINEKDGYVLDIGGDMTITGGNIKFNDKSNATPIINVDGDFTISGGSFDMAGKSSTTMNMNVKGNWSHSVGTLSASGSSSVVEVNFTKSGIQTFTTLLPLTSGSIDYNINNGSTLRMGTSIMLGRNFSLNAGGTIEVGALLGLIGNIQVTGTKTYSPDGSYIYSGAATQNMGAAAALTVKNLTIDNGGTTTLASNLTVTGVLNLADGKINTGSNTIYITNNATNSLVGHSSSDYIIGNLNRAVSSSGSYVFPMGSATKYQPMTMTLSGTSGFSNVTGRFTESDPTDAHTVDAIYVNGTYMQELLNHGYWTLTPNSPLTSGKFSLETVAQGHSNLFLAGTVYTLVRRANSSSNWENVGSHDIDDQNISGNFVTNKQTNLTSFGIYAVAIGDYGSFSNPTLISGTNGQAGAVYKFPNIVRGVDGWVYIMSLNNGATLDEIDDNGVGYNASFQPFINYPANKTAWIEWKIVLKKAGTSTDTTVARLVATGVDVDGTSSGSRSIREYIEATMPTSYNLDPYTNLTVANFFGNYRAIGDDVNINNIDSTKRQAMYELNYSNVNTLMYRTGAINTFNSSEVRQTSLFFKAFNLTNSNIALPIELISFNAKLKNDNVSITWSTAAEVNNDYFTIERSTDGENFEALFTKRGAGNSTVTIEYEANDPNPLDGYSYYRLKQTDFDGKFSYSAVETVKNKGGNDIDQEQIEITSISPNPFTEEFKIDFILKQKTSVEINMISTKGELIFKDIMIAEDGYNSYTYTDSKGLSPGYYFLTISYKDQKVTKKILKN